MKDFIKRIKKYKKAIYVLLMILAFLVFWLYLSKKEEAQTPLPPVLLELEQDKGTDSTPIVKENDFYILEVYPPSGDIRTISRYTHIMFKFSKPLATENIEVSVKPYITLAKEFSEDKSTLFIYPKAEPWLNQVRYSIKIANIRSTAGDTLDEGITILHEYRNDEPPIPQGGESAD